jgi:hypothetical protein
MDAKLKQSVQNLINELNTLPEEQRKRVAAHVNEIKSLSGLRLADLEKEMAAGCNCGPQGEPPIIPIW